VAGDLATRNLNMVIPFSASTASCIKNSNCKYHQQPPMSQSPLARYGLLSAFQGSSQTSSLVRLVGNDECGITP
jgi:hypothetical protein